MTAIQAATEICSRM